MAEGDNPSSVMFSAHIDRHGLICTGPNEFQYAAFVAGARSDLLGNSVSELLMNRISDRFESQPVYAYEPWSGAYRGQGRIDRAYVCEHRNNLIFQLIGLEHLVAGSPVAFTDKLKVTNTAIAGQLDNVLTAAALVYLYEQGFQGTAFFTAQEEAGKSWRYLLEWFRRFGSSTNQLIVVDTSPYPDNRPPMNSMWCYVSVMQMRIFNTDTTKKLKNHCRSLGISYSYKDTFIEEKNRLAAQQGLMLQSLGSTDFGWQAGH